jgi:2-methylisocitrate lyase-like PEP mutase family enzyme
LKLTKKAHLYSLLPNSRLPLPQPPQYLEAVVVTDPAVECINPKDLEPFDKLLIPAENTHTIPVAMSAAPESVKHTLATRLATFATSPWTGKLQITLAQFSGARSVDATDLPVSADLEKGFGDAPEVVAETIRLAAEAGLVGCTIEDSTRDAARPLYDFQLAVERIAAATEAAHSLKFPFLVTARAHNFLYAEPSLDDMIRRLQAFEKVGADVLFAPGLPDLDAVREVCSAVSRPFNFMAGIKGKSFPVAELAAAGVKRISLATSLYRAAMTSLVNATRAVTDTGRFDFIEECLGTPELMELMGI